MSRERGVVAFALAIAVALAMGLSLRNGFVYDDVPAILTNPRVTDPSHWVTIPLAPYWLGTLWRPLTVAGFALQWWVGHGAPWLFHLVSLVGYWVLAMLVVALLTDLGVPVLVAALSTLLFVVHPAHVEVVANVVGQAEIWVAIALVAATRLYLRARTDGREQRALLPLLFVSAAAMVSKEQGYMAPVLLAGAESVLVPGGTRKWHDRMRLVLPVLIVAGMLFFIRGELLDSFKGENTAPALRTLDIGGRALTFLAIVPHYAELIVWPWHLQADYGPPQIPIGPPFGAIHLLGLALVLVVVALLAWSWRRAPVIAFGLVWFVVTLAPVANLVTATGMIMSERALFLPSIGITMVVAGALQRLAAARDRRGTVPDMVGAGLLAAWIVTATVRSATRVAVWQTQAGFFTAMTRDAPRAYRAWKAVGDFRDEQHDSAGAIAALSESVRLWPHDSEVFERLGQVYRTHGNCAAAVPAFAAGVAVDSELSSLRAKLIECLIVLHRWDDATARAETGMAMGLEGFKSEKERVDRARTRADSAVH